MMVRSENAFQAVATPVAPENRSKHTRNVFVVNYGVVCAVATRHNALPHVSLFCFVWSRNNKQHKGESQAPIES